MNDFKKEYELWDEFTKIWPLDRLSKMTLDEYNKAGSKDSFTYWIESELDTLGSIWGGSSFKFGVYSRKGTDDKTSANKLSYSDSHAWYTSLGKSAEEAFTLVRSHVVHVATLATKGDLDGIQAFDQLGEAYKWKISFHYQDRNHPVIVNIFKKAPLAIFVGDSATRNMAALQKAAVARRPSDLGIVEYGRTIWMAWSEKNLDIWKISHGDKEFKNEEKEGFFAARLVTVHRETGMKQGEKFAAAPIGTLFFLCHGNSLQCVGQFTSLAVPCEKGDGWLQRTYRVIKIAKRTDRYLANSKKWSPKGNSTFWKVGPEDLPVFQSTLLIPYFGLDLAELAILSGDEIEVSGPNISGLPNPLIPMPISPIIKPLNRIYYGPPGTGKTFALTRLLRRDYEQPMQSISSEEWQSEFIEEKIAVLKWWECAAAALYDLGGKAKVSDIANHRFIQAIKAVKHRSSGVNQTLWGALQNHTIETSKTVNTKVRTVPAIFDKTESSQWQFAGDWLESCEELRALVDTLNAGQQNTGAVQRYSFVTFHQSYGYEEFVEGLRPVLSDDVETSDIQYEIRSGVFKDLCRKARLSPDQRFAMVIDEINRGNISKILGELITLIEADKRDPLDGSRPPAEVTLAYSGEKFSVPANVDIIGTMNTADRSLALLDTALRRRFDFVALMPDTRSEKALDEPDSAPLAGLTITIKSRHIDVRAMLHQINQRIEALYDRDHCIGHAFFTGLAHVADGADRFTALEMVFRQRIVPLLEEYFFEDWQKIRLVLGDNQKLDVLSHFVRESEDHEQDLNSLFGNDHGLDTYSTKRNYAIQEIAFSSPDAYLGIYQTVTP